MGDHEPRAALDDALPGTQAVARGPYRWFRHPNYLIGALEIAVVPLALRLPAFALAFTLANAAVLSLRIRVEGRALAWAAQVSPTQEVPAATLANGYTRR